MRKRILIAYATAGTGHKKAGLAIKAALDEMAPKGVEVSIIDSLDYTNAFFKWSYLKIYLLMVNRLPLLWGFLYYLSDNFYFNLAIMHLRRFNNYLNSKRLVNYTLSLKPDCIVSTHFFTSEVISDLKKKGLLKSRLITVVTDYRLHSWWISDGTDTYIVGSEDAKADLARCGIPSSKIEVLGIPVEPQFSKKLDRGKILKDAGLREGIFTIVVIGGGFGVGPIEDIIKVIAGISKPLQVITICGHNESLIKTMVSLKAGLNIEIKVLGYVNNVYDYMEISDILISKSGGITVSEALAKELPMIIIAPILGQETRNADYLQKFGAALKIDKLSDLKTVLDDLISHPEKIKAMKEAVRAIKRPMACYDIARLAMES